MSDLMRALGGPARVARACGVTMQAIGSWQSRDEIPPRHWLTIWRMAQAAGLDWSPPGAEDITIVPRARPTGGDHADTSSFTQCSHAASGKEAA